MDPEQGSQAAILVVSDALGETAELVARAAISQFNAGRMEIRRYSLVKDESEIEHIVRAASDGGRSVILYTLVVPELRRAMQLAAARAGVPAVDIMGPALEAVAQVVGRPPKQRAGLMHKLDEDYFRRVEAVEFAVKYDDGRDPRGLLNADLVLVGVSRTSKTPVSLYLAQRRYLRVANVPLVPELPPPEELFRLPPGKVVGLTVHPEKLYQIRQERLKAIGLDAGASYGQLDRIVEELEFAEQVFRRLGCPVVDVSNKAVEETANTVLHYLGAAHTTATD